MKNPLFKEKLLKQEPDFTPEIEKLLADNVSNKTRDEIAQDAALPTKLTRNYETQFILGTPPNYEPKKEDSIAAVAKVMKDDNDIEDINDIEFTGDAV